MSQIEFDALLEKYLAGTCSPQEEKAVMEWYEDFINGTEIAMSTTEKDALERRIWSNIYESISTEEQPLPRLVWMWPRKYAKIAVACAVALVVVGAATWFYQRQTALPSVLYAQLDVPKDYVDGYVKAEGKQHVVLGDGSVVDLEEGSTIYYPPQFEGKTREVFLTGSAFFNVAPNAERHFKVLTQEGMVAEVLGTSFFISHDHQNRKVELSVLTGKVSVYEQPEQKGSHKNEENGIILSANQKVTYKSTNNQFVTTLVEEPQPISEPVDSTKRLSQFVFEEATLKEVLTTISNTYGIAVEMNNEAFNNCHFTGDLSKQNLYEKLDIICKSVQASYEVKGTAIYINGTGCNR
ncbi:FecR family protein [Chitinophaga skermanii]|uniref:FecR family protein n=1 Tax=Chitinophaga skermanii TaxID=331697 RepID=A0A327R4A9_9BACT|nr:FecR family protein [Chitinophaga skermanii]RAJ10563.1 FecR family protein [Chitinophaga skermanii]